MIDRRHLVLKDKKENEIVFTGHQPRQSAMAWDELSAPSQGA